MKPTHSDNAYLQCLLLEVGFQDMKDEMRKRHTEFRKKEKKIEDERKKRHDDEERKRQEEQVL